MGKSRNQGAFSQIGSLGSILSEILQTPIAFRTYVIPENSLEKLPKPAAETRFTVPVEGGFTLVIEPEAPISDETRKQIEDWLRLHLVFPRTLGLLLSKFASMVPPHEDPSRFLDAISTLFLGNLPFHGFILYEKVLEVLKVRGIRYLHRRKIQDFHGFPVQLDTIPLRNLPTDHPLQEVLQGQIWYGKTPLHDLFAPWVSPEEVKEFEQILKWKSIVAVPLFYEGQVLGVVILGFKTIPEDPLWEPLLQSLRWFIGFLWWRVKVFQHLERTRRLEQGLRESIEMAIEKRPKEEIALHMLKTLLETSGAFKAAFFEVKDQTLLQRAHIGFSSYYPQFYAEVPWGQGLAGKVAEALQTIVVQDVQEDPQGPTDLVQREGFRSYIGFPVMRSGTLYGVVELFFSKPYEVTPEVLEFTERAGEVFGITLEQYQERKQEIQRLRVLERVQEVQRRIFSTLRLEGIVNSVKEALIQLPDVRKVRFFLVHQDENARLHLEELPEHQTLDPFSEKALSNPLAQCIRTGRWVQHARASGRKRGTKPVQDLYIPLRIDQHVRAVIHLEASDPAFPSDEDRQFLEVVVDSMALALRNVEVYERSLKVTQDLDFMYSLLHRSVTLNFEEFLEGLTDSILSVFHPDAFLFAHVEENEVVFDVLWEEGEHLKAEPMNLNEVYGLTGYILQKRKALLLRNAEVDSPVEYSVVGKVMRSYLGVPIVADGEVIGVISVQSQQPEAFTTEDLHLLEMIANTLANVIRNIIIHKREQASRYFLDTVLSHTPDWIVALDREGVVIYSNPQSERIIGMSPRFVIGQPLSELLPEVDLDSLLVSIRSKGEWGPVEFRFQRRPEDRETLYLSVSGSLDPEGKIILVIRDVTKEHDLEIQLRKAGYLSAVGELAAGVAHEINNPLTAVIGLLDLWLERGQVPPELASDLRKVRELASKAAVIAKDLLSIAGAHRMDRSEPFELNHAVDKVLDLFRSELGKYSIEVKRKAKHTPIYLIGREGEIQQVLINFLLNAKDAMVSSRKGNEVIVLTDLQDRMAILEVRDNGPGIPQEHLRRIFDPFFTTKPPGKGTGLGLALSLKIAQEHGGTIEVKSEEGKGATFRLLLPVREVPSDQVPKPVPRILFAEKDQTMVRSMESFFNRNHVYFRIFTTGEEFFEYLAAMDFDLVIVAEDLPKLSFRDQFMWLKQRRPDMVSKMMVLVRPLPPPNLFVFLQEQDLRILLKPISPELLQEIIREIFEDTYKMVV